ncbi:MAG: monofunctional biosynthetic peptidoglycan transglycosylase [Thermoanaerobaculia bacterium]
MKKIFLIVFLALLLFVGWKWLTFPDTAKLRREKPKTTAFMEERKAELRAEGKNDDLQYHWVPYSRIAPALRRAVLVSEDNSFYEHEGVDVHGLKEALRKDWEKKRFAYGGSTITQQLAKNLYLSPSKNPLRKIEELLIAKSLEKNLSKKRILELYLNVVEFGERVYGAEAAAEHYFGKHASELTATEAALLAGALPNPTVMDPGDPNKRLRARQRIILARLSRWGYGAEQQILTESRKQEEEQQETSTGETTTGSETSEPDTAAEAPESEPTVTSTSTTDTTGTTTPTETSSTTGTAPTETSTDTTTAPPPETTTTVPPPPTGTSPPPGS